MGDKTTENQYEQLLSRHGMVKSVWVDPFSDVISMYPHF
jgi:hypothetical protein